MSNNYTINRVMSINEKVRATTTPVVGQRPVVRRLRISVGKKKRFVGKKMFDRKVLRTAVPPLVARAGEANDPVLFFSVYQVYLRVWADVIKSSRTRRYDAFPPFLVTSPYNVPELRV